MNQWIACNLAWRVRLDSPKTLPYPNMDDKIKAHFGATMDEWQERFYPGLHTNSLNYMMDHPIFQEYQEIRDELIESLSETETMEELEQKLQYHPSTAVQTVLACRGICREITDWVEEQPEMTTVMEANEAIWKAHKEAEAKLSFCGQKLNQAGTLIEYKDNDKLTQLVIGDINELGGSCDDCRGINDDTVILRYRILWNGQES